MRHLYVRAVVVMVIAAAALLTVPSPATAGTLCNIMGICGHIEHYSPDGGYAPPILIECDFNRPLTRHEVYTGQSSTRYCKDTDLIYVRPGEEIWCKYAGFLGIRYWKKVFDATGWHQIHDDWHGGFGCTERRD